MWGHLIKKFFAFLLLVLFPVFFALKAEKEIPIKEDSITFEVVSAYLKKCSEKAKKHTRVLKANGTCGFVSFNDVIIDTKMENGVVVIESDVNGNREEFDDYTVSETINDSKLLKYKLLKAHQNAKKNTREDITIIDGFTKGERRVVYSGRLARARYTTVLTQDQLQSIQRYVSIEKKVKELGNSEDNDLAQEKYKDAIQNCLNQVKSLMKNRDKYETGVAEAAIENCLKQAEKLFEKMSQAA